MYFSKTAQVIKYLLRELGHTGTTKLLKLVYLADLQARSLLERPVSTLDYEFYNHGPFDKRFYIAIEELEEAACAVREKHTYPNGMEEDRVTDTDTDAPHDSLTPGEIKILDYTVRRFGPLPLSDILEYVYKTEPMKLVKTREERLPMNVVDGQLKSEIGFDLDEIMARERRARAGQRVPAQEVFDALRAGVRGERDSGGRAVPR
jgi:hypothetical protein